jgi:signal transduction histidine kinase
MSALLRSSQRSKARAEPQPWYRWRDDTVLQSQVELMRRNFPVTLLASLAAALGAVWCLWTLVNNTALYWWLGSHTVIAASVYGVVRWWLPQSMHPRWSAWGLLVCMTAMGLAWGSLALVTVAHGQPEALVFATAIMGGVSSGALGLGASLLPAFLAYLVWPVGMVMLAFAYIGGPVYTPMVWMCLVYFSLTCAQARSAEHSTYRAILLKLENSDLVQRLRKESVQSKTALDQAELAHTQAKTAQAMAEKANTDKSKFLAAASHDLRQPLHAMGLFLEALSRSELSDHQISVMDHAHAASNAASEMLTTLLDFSRLEAGVVTSKPKPFLLQPMLVKLEQEFGVQADTKELLYRTRETTLAAYADPNLTDLVLRNLISNAIRYTDRGGMLVACRKRPGAVVIEVWDTGMGIAQDQHTEVFKEFHQLGNPERDRRKGLGLGLAIVERISTAMGAMVTMRSEPGRGSVFRLWLQEHREDIAQHIAPSQHGKDLRGMRVLVIDDEEPVRLGMQQLLDSWGCISYSADALSSALHYVALQPMDQQPQVILADYRLREGATGAQAIHALRAYLTLRGHESTTPAIIITGDTAPERIREARRTEATLLYKPVLANDLKQALLQLR